MRPLGVEFAPQAVKPSLLLADCGGQQRHRLLLQRQMKPLVAPILLWLPKGIRRASDRP
jgi:hypothetical protein